jgi:hypothetical protein
MRDSMADAATEARSEAAIRSFLVGERPADGAPEALRGRVLAIPSVQVGWTRRLVTWLPAAAIAGLATIAIAVFGTWAAQSGLLAPEGAGQATPQPFDPLIEGPGMTYGVARTLLFIPGFAAVLAGLLGLRSLLRWFTRRRLRDLVPVGLCMAIVAGAIWLGSHPGFELGSFYQDPVGFGVHVDPAPGSGGATTFYETAAPGDEIAMAFSIRNPGPLPIRLEGVDQAAFVKDQVIYRWTSLWIAPVLYSTDVQTLQPFRPTVVAPGDELLIYVVGKAGTCAIGPSFSLDDAAVAGYTSRGRQLDLSYSVLGLGSVASLTLPFELLEPARNGCGAGG